MTATKYEEPDVTQMKSLFEVIGKCVGTRRLVKNQNSLAKEWIPRHN